MITIKGVDPRMIANNITPHEPTHPGEILKEEIEYRGLSQRKLAAQMGVSHSVLNEVLNAKRPLTTEYALLIEAAMGIDACIFYPHAGRLQLENSKTKPHKNKPLKEQSAALARYFNSINKNYHNQIS